MNEYILTEADKKKIIKIVGRCEQCGTKEKLQVHRIIRKYNGGKYTLRNLRKA